MSHKIRSEPSQSQPTPSKYARRRVAAHSPAIYNPQELYPFLNNGFIIFEPLFKNCSFFPLESVGDICVLVVEHVLKTARRGPANDETEMFGISFLEPFGLLFLS